MTRIIDRPGRRYGLLVVQQERRSIRNVDGRVIVLWRCVCDCGGESWVRTANLTNGNTKSCGCLRRAAREAQKQRARERALRPPDEENGAWPTEPSLAA